jgi:hypothetical protein
MPGDWKPERNSSGPNPSAASVGSVDLDLYEHTFPSDEDRSPIGRQNRERHPERPSSCDFMAQIETAAEPPSCHPRPGRGQFLPRLGYGQQGLVATLREKGVTTTVAPLHFLRDNPELSLIPVDRPSGLVLDPCCQLRLLPWSERRSSFRSLAFGNDPEPYAPDSARLTDEQILGLAIEPVAAARARGGTLLLTAAHPARGVGTRGRDIELLLAELGIRHFLAEGMQEPPQLAALALSREIYASIAVHARDLATASARGRLADAYQALEADGFWVQIEGFHERASKSQIRDSASFLAALRESGRPVVSSGSGQLHLGLLADDFPVSIGLGENERFRAPSAWRDTNGQGKRRGRTRMAYHPKLHRSFRVGSEDATTAFAAAPCECGIHDPDAPPDGRDVAKHAAILRVDQALEALEGEREERREWVLASSAMASWAAADAGLPPAKSSATRAYESLFEGLDAVDGIAASEQTGF